MNGFEITERPELRDPILVIGYFGWNDAAEAATDAVKFLRGRAKTAAFAAIDPDDYFVFTEHRPTVRWVDGQSREVLWPSTDFTPFAMPEMANDMILGLGTEPDLRWKAYGRALLELIEKQGVSEVVTLGALLADVAHTRPVPVSGGASDPERAELLGFPASKYEGPTGILGAIGDLCRRESVRHISIWASVPHYVTSRHNPSATKALLQELDRVYGLELDLGRLDGPIARYRTGVDDALRDKPDVLDYVRTLEEQTDAGESPGADDGEDATAEAEGEPLESQDVLAEVDRLLRGSTTGEDDS